MRLSVTPRRELKAAVARKHHMCCRHTCCSVLKWFRDPEKCTFIVIDRSMPGDHIAAMVGDVNLYLNDPEDSHHAEIEVCIFTSSV